MQAVDDLDAGAVGCLMVVSVFDHVEVLGFCRHVEVLRWLVSGVDMLGFG